MPAEGWQATSNSGPPPNKAEGFSSLRAVIFANGELRDREAALAALRPDDWLIAANGGARHCPSLGTTPAVVVRAPSLGVSNVLVRPPATLEVRQGEVIAIVTRVASAGGAA